MKKVFVITLIVLLLFVSAPSIVRAAPPTTVNVAIYRAQLIDPIETPEEGGADWHYRITLTDNAGTQEVVFNDADYYDSDDTVFNQQHLFYVDSLSVAINVYLYEYDPTGNETADISGSGIRTTLTFLYDLKTNTLTGDQTQTDGDYLKTSGDVDGSTEIDQNDANLWFRILDNYDAPVADAGPDRTVATGSTINFDGSLCTASAGSEIVLYQWDFDGDGVFDDEGYQTSFTYDQKGTHVFALKITDNFGQTFTDTCVLLINSPPVASFTFLPSEPEVGSLIDFTENSFDVDGVVSFWYWTFGDGDSTNERNPSHQYSQNGTFSVTLTVTDNNGLQDSLNVSVFVLPTYELPVANAGSDKNIISGETVSFDGSLSTASTASLIEMYQWDFDGDGVFDAEGMQTSHTYTEKGTFTVVLRVTDNYDEIDIDTCTVVVTNAEPTSQFTFSPVEATIFDTVNFTETSSDVDGTISSWHWEFGDGTTSNERNPVHQYSQTGTYTVRLTVTDNDGAENTKTASITVANLEPTADFSCSASEITAGETVQFTDNSTDPEDAIVSWLWDFGDGETSTAQNSAHTFESAGSYHVTLTVTDDGGVTDAVSITITVTVVENVVPVANFVCENTEFVAGNEIVFSESSQDQDGNIVSWSWDFGDGTTSTEQNPAHKFDSPGEYTITLTVTDDQDAQDTYTRTIEIQATLMEQYMLFIVVGVFVVVAVVAAILGIRRKKNSPETPSEP